MKYSYGKGIDILYPLCSIVNEDHIIAEAVHFCEFKDLHPRQPSTS